MKIRIARGSLFLIRFQRKPHSLEMKSGFDIHNMNIMEHQNFGVKIYLPEYAAEKLPNFNFGVVLLTNSTVHLFYKI